MEFLSFQENATIVKLDLSGNHLGEAGAKHMSDVLNNNTIISDLVSTVCLSVCLFSGLGQMKGQMF